MSLEFHPIADLFPLLEGEEFEALVASIRTGWDSSHPIVMYEGKILDGRNRARAAEKAGVVPTYQQWVGDDPWAFVWGENGLRRHLEPGQRAALLLEIIDGSAAYKAAQEADKVAANAARSVAAKEQHAMSNPWKGEKKDGACSFEHAPSPRHQGQKERKALAKAAGVSPATIQRIKELKKEDPAAFEAVKRGEKVPRPARQAAPRQRAKKALKWPIKLRLHNVASTVGQKDRVVHSVEDAEKVFGELLAKGVSRLPEWKIIVIYSGRSLQT